LERRILCFFWSNAKNYDFVNVGHGRWYSNTLNMLNVRYRIWVNISKTGYVDVGKVTGDITRAEEYQFKGHDNKTLAELDTKAIYKDFSKPDDDNTEYLVPVE
jgi:hypothetical protein